MAAGARWSAADLERLLTGGAAALAVHHLPRAVEDLPPEVRDAGARILSTPGGRALRERIVDVVENAVLDLYGRLELVHALAFLSRYPVTPYTYDVVAPGWTTAAGQPLLTRGELPDTVKLRCLEEAGCGAHVNLCAETARGDAPLLARAGVRGITPYHIPVVDMEPPALEQVVAFLDLLVDLRRRGVRAYVHCEAGKGRTGVMVACARMALMGWSVEDALTEARNFGCSVPMQLAFIQDLGRALEHQWDARRRNRTPPSALIGGYPLVAPGSVRATRAQLTATRQRDGAGVC